MAQRNDPTTINGGDNLPYGFDLATGTSDHLLRAGLAGGRGRNHKGPVAGSAILKIVDELIKQLAAIPARFRSHLGAFFTPDLLAELIQRKSARPPHLIAFRFGCTIDIFLMLVCIRCANLAKKCTQIRCVSQFEDD